MASLGERLWDMGRSPTQHLTLLVFGLFALLTGLIASAVIGLAGAGGVLALAAVAFVITGVGAFFVTLALFLGAYVSSGESVTAVVWRVAQLLAAVLVLIFVFR